MFRGLDAVKGNLPAYSSFLRQAEGLQGNQIGNEQHHILKKQISTPGSPELYPAKGRFLNLIVDTRCFVDPGADQSLAWVDTDGRNR